MEWEIQKNSEVHLKRCPACGNENVWLYLDKETGKIGKVRCSNISCGLETGAFALKGMHAIELWNDMPRRCPRCFYPVRSSAKKCINCHGRIEL